MVDTRRRRYANRPGNNLPAPGGVSHAPTMPAGEWLKLYTQTGQPRPQDASQSPAILGSVYAAEGKLLPIVYGRVFLDGFVGPMYVSQNKLISGIFYAGCEIDGFESIFLDESFEDAWTNGAHGERLIIPYSGSWDRIEITQYHGLKTQIVDPNLAAYIPGYADTCVLSESELEEGQAYLSLLQSAHGDQEPIVPRVIVRGTPCYDPRTTQTVYTDNPALHLADFLTADYGAGTNVDWDSVSAAADMNDELVDGKKRYWGSCVINEVDTIESHIESMRALAGVMLRVQGSTIYMIPNRPRASMVTLGTGNVLDESIKLRYRDLTQAPSRVEVAWTDTSVLPWAQRIASYEDPALTATEERRTTRITLPGIQSHEVAYRYAIQQWRAGVWAPWELEVDLTDPAVQMTVGDVATINLPIYTGAMEVVEIRSESAGKPGGFLYRLFLVEYDPAIYSDDDVPDTPITLPGGGNPFNPTPVVAVSAREVIIADQMGQMHSRVEAVFTAVEDGYVTGYQVIFTGTGFEFVTTVNQQQPGSPILVYSSDLENFINNPGGLTMTVGVVSLGAFGQARSAVVEGTTVVKGKYLPPPDVPSFVALVWIEGVGIRATWETVNDIGGVRYNLRISQGQQGTWEDATPVNHRPILDSTFLISVFNTEDDRIWVWVKAIDNAGLESENAAAAFFLAPDSDNLLIRKRYDVEDVLITEPNYVSMYCAYGESEGLRIIGTDHNAVDRVSNSGALTDSSYQADSPWWHYTNYPVSAPGWTVSRLIFLIDDPDWWDVGVEQMRESHIEFVGKFDVWNEPAGVYGTSMSYRMRATNLTLPNSSSDAQNQAVHAVTRYVGSWVTLDYGKPPNEASGSQYGEIKFPVYLTSKRKVLPQEYDTPISRGNFPLVWNFARQYIGTPNVAEFTVVGDFNVQLGISAISNLSMTVIELSSQGQWSGTMHIKVIGE